MIRRLINGGVGSTGLLGAFLPMDWDDHDRVSHDIKTASDFHNRPQDDDETGMDRIKMMFTLEYVCDYKFELNHP